MWWWWSMVAFADPFAPECYPRPVPFGSIDGGRLEVDVCTTVSGALCVDDEVIVVWRGPDGSSRRTSVPLGGRTADDVRVEGHEIVITAHPNCGSPDSVCETPQHTEHRVALAPTPDRSGLAFGPFREIPPAEHDITRLRGDLDLQCRRHTSATPLIVAVHAAASDASRAQDRLRAADLAFGLFAQPILADGTQVIEGRWTGGIPVDPSAALVQTLDDLGVFLDEGGDPEAAVPVLQFVRRAAPDRAELLLHLADAQWHAGRADASQTYRDAVALGGHPVPRDRQRIGARPPDPSLAPAGDAAARFEAALGVNDLEWARGAAWRAGFDPASRWAWWVAAASDLERRIAEEAPPSCVRCAYGDVAEAASDGDTAARDRFWQIAARLPPAVDAGWLSGAPDGPAIWLLSGRFDRLRSAYGDVPLGFADDPLSGAPVVVRANGWRASEGADPPDCTLGLGGLAVCRQLTPPDGVRFVAIDSREGRACGLEPDHTLRCWGDDTHGWAPPSTAHVVAFVVGRGHTCVIDDDGAARCLGTPPEGFEPVPPSRPPTLPASVYAAWIHAIRKKSSTPSMPRPLEIGP